LPERDAVTYLVEIIEYGTGDVLQAVAFESEDLARSVERGIESILSTTSCETHYVLLTEDETT
jgi:hypothetical protein